MLDFAIWERDQINPAAYSEWLAAIAAAPFERIGRWMKGIDSELLGLILRRGAAIYDLSEGGPPEEPEGTFYPTPDGFFVLDVPRQPGRRRRPRSGPGADHPGRRALPDRQRVRPPDHRRRHRRARRGAGRVGLSLAAGAHGRPRLRRLLRGARGLPRARPGERPHRRSAVRARARSSTRGRPPTAPRCGSRRRWPSASATPTARRSRAPPRSSPPATSWTISASRWSRSPTACSPPIGSRPATTRRSGEVLDRLVATLDLAVERLGARGRRARRGGAAHDPVGAAVSPGRQPLRQGQAARASPCAAKVRSARRDSTWPRATTRRSSRP